jgi:hypothetical protein
MRTLAHELCCDELRGKMQTLQELDSLTLVSSTVRILQQESFAPES